MARTIREVDEAKIRDCKEDIDTVLVFVSSTTLLQALVSYSPIASTSTHLGIGRSFLSRDDSLRPRNLHVATAGPTGHHRTAPHADLRATEWAVCQRECQWGLGHRTVIARTASFLVICRHAFRRPGERALVRKSHMQPSHRVARDARQAVAARISCV